MHHYSHIYSGFISHFSQPKAEPARKNTFASLSQASPIYHDTTEEQQRAQAYIAAGYVPFGLQLDKAIENHFQSASEYLPDSELPDLQALYLNPPETDFEFEQEFPDLGNDFEFPDPYAFDTGPALGDLINELRSIKREIRDYTGRIDHIIRLNKKDKIYTEGRVQSSTLQAIASGELESNQQLPTKFTKLKDPKKAIGKMASSVPIGPNGRGPGADGSQHGSISSMPQGQEGNQILEHSQYKISDLIHPTLNSPLKNHQQVTFRLVKQGKTFMQDYLKTFNCKGEYIFIHYQD